MMSAWTKRNVGRPDVGDVRERSGLDVVHADDAMTPTQQLVAQVRAEEPRATRDEAGGHEAGNSVEPVGVAGA